MRAAGSSRSPVTNLTEGPVVGKLLRFALPFLASSLIQQMYNTVDMMFVGKLLGKEAAAAVGASSQLTALILGLFTGLSAGVGVAAANAFGGGSLKRLKMVVHTAAGLTLVLGCAVLILGLVFAPTFLVWMSVPADILPIAAVYIRIYFLSLLSIVGYNMSAGLLRALGDSRSPTLYQFIGGIANLFGNTMFLYVLKWGVPGAAAATFLSQSVAAVLTIRRVCRLDERYRLRFREIRVDLPLCRNILAVGIPAAVQAMVMSLSNIIVQSRINRLGVDNIAAFTAYYKEENFVYLPIVALGQANITFSSQNIGAGRPGRAKQGTRASVLIGVAVTVFISAVMLLGHQRVFGLFTNDSEVIRIGWTIARMALPFYFLYVFLEVLSSSIRGAGKALPPMLIILANTCLLRVAVLEAVMRVHPTAAGVALVYPITWTGSSLMLFLYYQYGRWRPECLTKNPDRRKT